MNSKKTIRLVYNLIIIALVLTGLFIVVDRFVHFGRIEFTDNARIEQHITPVNTRIAGFIREVRFEEYQHVRRGDTLVIIEDAEYRLAVAQARAGLANAQAGHSVAGAGITTTTSTISATAAAIDEARVQMENAGREDERFAALLRSEAVTQQQYDAVHTAYLAAQARYEAAVKQREALVSVKAEHGHRLAQAEAGIETAEAALHLARLNLSYTVIVATADGVIGHKDIHEGQYVNAGQTMCAIVDEAERWVVANYRETQIAHIAVGAKVEMKVDAVPGVMFEGEVERISDATGAAYSIIPQDNATGNFVKVEQRIPVRIRLLPNEAMDRLRAGMNVECEVKY
ncbi:MAG: HlyD family secretion protein [Bacteroidales bacterium]|nr:HlyD family secretion protein [Bacteroidales bacterium]